MITKGFQVRNITVQEEQHVIGCTSQSKSTNL